MQDESRVPQGLSDLFARSAISLSLADPSLPDAPLIAVNRPFLDLTGYEANEVIGRNCRFLQPEGGAGPVRARIREFLEADERDEHKFVIPNVRKSGEPFLNLVYIAKLNRPGRTPLLLGSQFDASGIATDAVEMYEQALREDIRKYNLLASDRGWEFLNSFDALASSHALIAKARLDD